MDESWTRVDALLQAALERPQAEREAFVRDACGGDAVLEREVRSLIDSFDQAGTFLERPAVELDEETDPFIGRDVSHYHIVERLGGGGMGVVYRAQDQRLHRFVALKFLADEFANDPECISRFRREGRAASALNHPNICTIYDVGDSDGHPFLVMEHLEGATLKERLAGTRLPADRVVALGLEILDGLEAAHRAGIVHRDIKPANIFITSGGHAKILDFGLAKTHGVAADATASANDETRVGAVLGTAAYMAPEQARGGEVDPRTDLWAFGIVLYEMLTGVRPIAGIGPSADVPAPFATIIARCLEPGRDHRYQRAGEVRAAITRIRRGYRRVWLTAAAAITLLVGSGLVAANVADIRERWTGSGRGHVIHSIAVLPLVNLSADPSQDYLTDGLTDELITTLARQTSARVVSRSSVMRYKGTRLPTRDIARELGVDSVLEGSVTRVGDTLHVTAQLIDAASDAHLWAQSYDRSFDDALTLPGEVSRTVAREAGLGVLPPAQPRTVNPTAHDAYLRGRFMWFSPGSGGLEYFEKAIALQPDYALAWSGLADAYITAASTKPPLQVMPLAAAAARKAVELDDSLPEAHLSLAASLFYGSWELKPAQAELLRTLELNPNFAEAHHLYGYLLNALDRTSEAIAEQRRSMELDPFARPWALGRSYVQARQFDAAVQELRMRDAARPGTVRSDLIKAYWYAGMWREWVDETAREFRASNDETSAKAVERAFDRGGKAAAAEWLLSRLETRARDHYVSFNALAYATARLERTDATLAYLERAYDERYPFLITLKSDPIYDFLRHDPRYLALLRKIGIPQSVQ
jgi:serine/threonine-protein kinase